MCVGLQPNVIFKMGCQCQIFELIYKFLFHYTFEGFCRKTAFLTVVRFLVTASFRMSCDTVSIKHIFALRAIENSVCVIMTLCFVTWDYFVTNNARHFFNEVAMIPFFTVFLFIDWNVTVIITNTWPWDGNTKLEAIFG